MLCVVCQERHGSGPRCDRCRKYWLYYGGQKERPTTLPSSTLPTCEMCGQREALAKNLCYLCYNRKRQRYGEKPSGRTSNKNCICVTCEERPAKTKGRCARCSDYWRRHSRERPREGLRTQCRVRQPCRICHERLTAAVEGRCKRCKVYYKNHNKQKERPKVIDRSHSIETREKLSAAKLGKPRAPFTEAHRANMRAVWAKKRKLREKEKQRQARKQQQQQQLPAPPRVHYESQFD